MSIKFANYAFQIFIFLITSFLFPLLQGIEREMLKTSIRIVNFTLFSLFLSTFEAILLGAYIGL